MISGWLSARLRRNSWRNSCCRASGNCTMAWRKPCWLTAAMAAVNQHGLRQAMVQLPEARQHELRQLLRRNRADSQPLIMAGRQARQDVIKQLEAPTLDRPALLTDLGKAREADVALRALVDNTLAEFADTLP